MFIESGNYKVLLREYSYRQVVINEKEEDMLVNRLGFNFDSIKFETNIMSFMKSETCVYTIPLEKFTECTKKIEFPHFFEFASKDCTIEIYFP